MRPIPALLCLFASQAVAGPFDGVWSPDPAQCAAEYDPERVIVTDKVLLVQESRCDLGQPTPATSPAGAIIYSTQCQGLEDPTPSSGRIALLLTADDRLAIIAMSTNAQVVYSRCD